jgi:ankyrin repeat protein
MLTIIGLTVLMVAASGDTRVVDAAMKGDRETVRTLLKQAADVNAAQGDGMTALHWAALKGDAEMADLLIYAGANLKAATRLGGYTPLFMAGKSGSAPVIERLLKAGADPKAAASFGLTPLMMAATAGDPESVRLLLEHGADPNAAENEHGQTPLSFAAAFNRAEAIGILVKHGAKVDAASTVIKPTPPQRGGFGNFAQTNQAAAPAGARGAAAAPAAGAPAPAAQGGREGRGAQAAPPPANGAPAQSAAAAGAGGAQGQGQAAAAMNGADGAARGGGNDKGGLTPLMYAARQGSEDAAQALVENGANIDQGSADKSTALLLATINAHFGLAKMLVERGANPNIASADGATPLYGVVNTQWARHSGYPQPTPKYEKTSYLELMKLLLDRGADPNARLVKELWYSEYNFSLESASAAGTTAFWKCAEVGDIDGMKLLVSRGADPDIASRDGVTPLLMASGAGTHGNDDVTAPPGRMAAIRYLVEELHANVNAADTAGGQRGGGGNAQQQQQLAVQLATDANNGKPPSEAQIAEQLKLIQQRQQGQQEGFGGRGGGVTALHNAASRGDTEMILYLVSKGARVDAVANNGASVADLANGPRQRIQPYAETVALLEMLGSKNSHKCVSC